MEGVWELFSLSLVTSFTYPLPSSLLPTLPTLPLPTYSSAWPASLTCLAVVAREGVEGCPTHPSKACVQGNHLSCSYERPGLGWNEELIQKIL